MGTNYRWGMLVICNVKMNGDQLTQEKKIIMTGRQGSPKCGSHSKM